MEKFYIGLYISSLAKYLEGRENGRWIKLPMETQSLEQTLSEIKGKDEELIILDSDAPFEVNEYEDISELNKVMLRLQEEELDPVILKALFFANPDRVYVLEEIFNKRYTLVNVDEVSKGWCSGLCGEELYGMVLNHVGYNNLFENEIPEEMIDYINFEQIYTCLAANDGWVAVRVADVTYLVSV